MIPKQMLSKRRVLLIISIFFALALLGAYLYWPVIISKINPQERIAIVSVTYPEKVYRTQRFPILVKVINNGGSSKDILVEVASKDSSVLSNKTRLSRFGSIENVSISLPLKSLGQQAFTVKVYWIGPGEICKIEQESKDGTFVVLGAEYDVSSTPVFAPIAENFDLSLTITNKGTAPATQLTIQVAEKGRLSIFPPDSQILDNFQAGETRRVTFRFTVPHDAPEDKCTITLNLKTSYPVGSETVSKDVVITLQKSPTQVELENWIFWIEMTTTFLIAVYALYVVIMHKKHR